MFSAVSVGTMSTRLANMIVNAVLKILCAVLHSLAVQYCTALCAFTVMYTGASFSFCLLPDRVRRELKHA